MKALSLLCTLLLTSCGWHVAGNYHANKNHTLAIPYAYGDSDGLLTNELVAQVQKETAFSYVQDGGEYTLKVELLDSKSENIGFRYDPKKLESGKKKADTRRSATPPACKGNSYSNGHKSRDIGPCLHIGLVRV